ncbi:MAG TPA: 50S ribosomal protein L15 [Anaerolineales bacterium]|nr:50S ribosomal protein L15 [Anaerolineales bacterium]HRF48070.1 50S ribosomal protein L15 [Anaerolineales bacterium]
MKAHEIAPNQGATKRKRRVGRGISAGQGKTAGRGTKGYGARRGGGGKLYRQGGNLPFYRSLPFKRGFVNIFRVEFQEVNVGDLAALGAETVSIEQLFASGLISNLEQPVVLLGYGEVSSPVTVQVHRASKGALEKMAKAGGKVEIIG